MPVLSPAGRVRAGLIVGLLAGLAVVVPGCSPSSPGPPPPPAGAPPPQEEPAGPSLFEDVTARSGIDFTYRNGEEANNLAIIESLGGGVALLDFDHDGRLDVFLTGGGYYDGKKVLGHTCKLYRNLGGFKFADVSTAAGLAGVNFQYSHGAAAFDYDNDGWTDILVTGYNRLVLLHNENEPDGKAGRRFVDVTRKAGLTDGLWSSCAAWGDLDGDGFADVYVTHYGDWGFDTNHPTNCSYDGKTFDVCQPRRFKPLPHAVYRNNRDGTFTDVTEKLKLRKDGRGLGVIVADLDRDGRPDVYVANDTDDNFLYMNRSKPGQLAVEEVGLFAGVARDDRGQANGSMGIDVADFDRSGLPSLLVTNYENELPALYRNRSDDRGPRFIYDTLNTGIAVIEAVYVSWGTGFADYDLDGRPDLFIVNGHAIRYPPKIERRQRPVLLRNVEGKFTPVTKQAGPYFRSPHNARGLAIGDLDNDGKPDLVVSHLNEPVVVLRNVAPTPGKNWVGFELTGAHNRDVTGARVVLESAGGRQTRFAKGGGSYASTPDPRHLFGLGTDAAVAKVTVYWPWGKAEEFPGVTPGAYWRLTECEGKPVRIEPPK